MPNYRRAKHNKNKRGNSKLSGIKDHQAESTSTTCYILKTSPILGRYLTAARRLSQGELIIEEEALVVGPCQGCPIMCLGCYLRLTQPLSLLQRCGRCGWPMCDVNCPGRNTRLGHSTQECATLEKYCPMFKCEDVQILLDTYNVIVPLRCLLIRDFEPDVWHQLEKMESHNDIRRNIPSIWYRNQKNVVDKIYKDWNMKQYSEEEIHTICGILEVNCFEIGRTEQSVRALFPTAFLLSHNCVPNTNHTDDNHYRLSIRSSVFIDIGEPITLSYAYTFQNTMKRRQHLKESKFFDCVCERCRDPSELGSYVGALVCSKCLSGRILSTNPLDPNAFWQCDGAKKGVCKDFGLSPSDLCKLTESIDKEADQMDCNDVVALEAFLLKVKKLLHPNHYHCLAAKHALSQLYGKAPGYLLHQLSSEQILRKRDLCQELIKILDIIEPGYSRLRGITLYELHAALMSIWSYKFETSDKTNPMLRKELLKGLKEVIISLSEASIILNSEASDSPEGQIGQAAKEALISLQITYQKLGGRR